MNVVVVCIDTLRWDYVGCYGHPEAVTPALDEFARRATRFDAAYCASFPTVPMRMDALTGQVGWPVYGWRRLRPTDTTFVQCLSGAGYHTGLVHDTAHLVGADLARDFAERVFIGPPPGWEANRFRVECPVPREHMRQNGVHFITDRARTMHYRHEADWFVARTMQAACEWLEDYSRRDRLLLWVDTFEPHEDWMPPEHYVRMFSPDYRGADYSYPNYGYADRYAPHELERLRARYRGEVALTDRWLGHLLRQIEVLGRSDDTMVVVLSDHGMYLGEHDRVGKHTVDPDDPWPLYDQVARIPLLIRMPGQTHAGRVSALVQVADLAPTILDACGVRGPAMAGRSLMPLLGGSPKDVHEHVFTSCHSHTGEGRIDYLRSRITVTTPEWTLITGPPPGAGALYDRRRDPCQVRNRIGSYPEVARDLRVALIEFMRGCGADEEYIGEFARL
ncbi:MAG TPA: sulfatase [Armatimonadota bacterium]|nr:sulfatase [Armatimonadota bacterium]